ncbi:flagellar hook-length control protein FliK [Cellvibrio japonicus]|nr:flagellar hook-length control protein FliK [Cellvibrio japonicus]QEI12531.1 flagellar hook-length control protein FliK [Cellvibrio japonicus]QEI16105.1 flagellar hook-length control protein FliK [Cellvibrio japonicus]QEI19683.1 flagellar hook-length control protein FliK [Cellvibrio japonicus]
MDLSKVNESLLNNLQQRQVEQVQVLSKVLGIKLGDQFLAQVQQLTNVTGEERAQLLSRINQQLQQVNQASTSPAAKALVNQLLAQQALVQSTPLHWVNLQALANPSNTSPVNTSLANKLAGLVLYTNLPLDTGQTLLLKLDANHRLVIQGALATGVQAQLPGLSSQPLSVEQLKILLTQVKPLPIPTATNPPTLPTDPKASSLEGLRNSLLNLLPYKDQQTGLLDQLEQFIQQTRQIPTQERGNWLSSQLQQALNSLANQLRSEPQLTHPKLLGEALRNNGVFFEHKLGQLATGNTGNALTSKTRGGENGAGITNNPGPGSGGKIPNIQPLVRQDVKAGLLNLLHLLETELTSLALPVTPGQHPLNTLGTQPTSPLANLFVLLMGMHSAGGQDARTDHKVLRQQLLMLLHQQTLGSLAKIQLQQLHALNYQQEQADTPLPGQSFQLDIPLRQGQELQHLQLLLEYHWVDDETREQQETNNKVRQWQVMLNFDLSSVGKFYVQLTLLGENLSANFWAERPATLEKTRARLAQLQTQLEKEGLMIKSLQCLQGLPPQPKMSLGYALVDVKT